LAGIAAYRIGSVLSATKWPRIRQARISDVSLNQGELEKFCSGLGYRLELISLHSIELLSGSWAGALDMLREKVSFRCLEMKCRSRWDELAPADEYQKKLESVGTFASGRSREKALGVNHSFSARKKERDIDRITVVTKYVQ
jgi:hypothetical protein